MAATFDCIHSINQSREDWKIKVRIVRLWSIAPHAVSNEPTSLEMVLQDEAGDRIGAFVRKGVARHHSRFLREGRAFILTQFGVVENSGSYRTTHHAFKVMFQYSTTVRPVVDNNKIHSHGFCFTPFSDIICGDSREEYLVDIIGRLAAVGEIQKVVVNGRQEQRLDILLDDDKRNYLEVTLWGALANDVLRYMKGPTRCPIIVIVQWCKIRVFKGIKKVSNSLFASRLFIHPTMDEVSTFVESLKAAGVEIEKRPIHLPNQPTLSVEDEILHCPNRKYICQLRGGPLDADCVIYAEVVSVDTERGWYYIGCQKCAKKVLPDGDGFYCDKCNEFVKSVSPRFRVWCRVYDASSSTDVLIFDKEFATFMKCSAAELKESIGRMDVTGVCEGNGFDKIIGKKFLFRVRISEDYAKGLPCGIIVNGMTDDENTVKSFLDKWDQQVPSPKCVSQTPSIEETESTEDSSSTITPSEVIEVGFANGGEHVEKSHIAYNLRKGKKIKLEADEE
ncbi:uncharacterized protein LOC129322577 [Prosopis cineraria]|uniref:uncharacterized protein LOC129299041 n=1 Tax=Prosopis cineraria TaxID=364024 RepID=UPI0024108038|nr:uncharacterized protein LOC129299041 [Prosopis cineraria]XP_054797561.1 uncharacterized protein LOC129302683 [Prosopis cineraria]XP_054824851.1 uncharacterized protein LOC129322577 [Prosopis cineraria]